MRRRLAFHKLLLLAVFLTLGGTTLAGTTWYVDGARDRGDDKSLR